MKKSIWLWITVSMLAALLLAACGPAATPTEEATAEPTEEATEEAEPTEEEVDEAEPTEAATEAATEPPAEKQVVKVGFITDQSGPLAIYGSQVERSFFLGLEYASGSDGGDDHVYLLEDENIEIQVFIRDDQSNPETTATVARELIDVEGVNLLVGTVSSGATGTLQEIARENEIPLIVAPAAAASITGETFNEYTFRVSRNSFQDAMAVCAYLTQNYSTFVQIAPDYSFGYSGAQANRWACENAGGEFVADDIFAPLDAADFTPYMDQMLDSEADAWMVTWAGPTFIQLFQAAKDTGVMDEMALGASFIDNQTMPIVYANAVGTTSAILYHYTQPTNEINDWLIEQIAARYDGAFPDLFDADGFNAALAVVGAAVESGGSVDSADLIAALEGLEFEGPKGTILIREEDHVAIQDMYIVTLLNLDDPEFKYYEAVETVRPEPPCLLIEDFAERCGDLPTLDD